MTIKEIVIEYLKAKGFDGLCNIEIECGCLLEDGLMPCDDPSADYCGPGYRCSHPDHPVEWAICNQKPTKE
jgi:hypothetical protein